MSRNLAKLLLAYITLPVAIISCNLPNRRVNCKYEICYPVGNHVFSDYTDTFELRGSAIVYTNHRGIQIVRSGTFSILPNK